MGTSLDVTGSVGTKSADRPVFFPESDSRFFGIISEPKHVPASTTSIIILSGTFGGTTTLGRNRFWLKMARSLADRGFRVLRLDYAGIGDSVGDSICHDMATPAVDELGCAFDLLSSLGADDFIVIGTCYGSRTALMGSVSEPRVRSLQLLTPPVGSGIKGTGGAEFMAEHMGMGSVVKKAASKRVIRKLLFDKRTRESAMHMIQVKARTYLPGGRSDPAEESSEDNQRDSNDFSRSLKQLLERKVSIHMLFGEEDFFWKEFEVARKGRLGRLLDSHNDLVEIETIPGIVRGFVSVRVQDACISSVLAWTEKDAR